MIYITTIAARIRKSSFESEASNAEAEPWKLVMILPGMPSACSVSTDAVTACQRAARRDVERDRVRRNWLR